MFWFNEEFHVDNSKTFWNESNIGTCYIELLEDLANRLDVGMLLNYFNIKENILKGKNQDMMRRLAARIRRRVQQLKHFDVE